MDFPSPNKRHEDRGLPAEEAARLRTMFRGSLRFAASTICSSEALCAILFVAAAVFHSQYLITSPGHIYITPQNVNELFSASLKTAHICTMTLFSKSPCIQMIPRILLNRCYVRPSPYIYHPLPSIESFIPLSCLESCYRVMHEPSFILFKNHSLLIRDFMA
jgi:hypothetical protein